MSLRIRRGTEPQRTGVTFDSGELVYTTDKKQLWIGDGITIGGTPLVGLNITGYGLTFNATSKKIEVAGLTADDISNGVNNKFFSTDLAQDAAAALFSAGSHTNITFQYDDTLNKINATVTLDGIGITDVVNDTSPQLGGNLDLNARNITGTGNINITGSITSSGTISASGLGGNLALNGNAINGTGNITITGYVSDSAIQNVNAVQRSLTNIGNATTPAELTVTGYGSAAFSVLGLSTSGNASLLIFKHSNGTYAVPTITATDDIIGGVEFKARNATAYVPSSIIVALVTDSSIANNSTSIDSTMFIGNTDAVLGGTGACLSIGPTGIVSAPIFKVGNVAGTLPSAPQAGMIVLDGTTFKGYNGSAWVNLN